MRSLGSAEGTGYSFLNGLLFRLSLQWVTIPIMPIQHRGVVAHGRPWAAVGGFNQNPGGVNDVSWVPMIRLYRNDLALFILWTSRVYIYIYHSLYRTHTQSFFVRLLYARWAGNAGPMRAKRLDKGPPFPWMVRRTACLLERQQGGFLVDQRDHT